MRKEVNKRIHETLKDVMSLCLERSSNYRYQISTVVDEVRSENVDANASEIVEGVPIQLRVKGQESIWHGLDHCF